MGAYSKDARSSCSISTFAPFPTLPLISSTALHTFRSAVGSQHRVVKQGTAHQAAQRAGTCVLRHTAAGFWKLFISPCTYLAPFAASRLVMKTCAPLSASAEALAKPRPELAPVTTTTLPVRSGMLAADRGIIYASADSCETVWKKQSFSRCLEYERGVMFVLAQSQAVLQCSARLSQLFSRLFF